MNKIIDNKQVKLGPDLIKDFDLPEGGTYKFFFTDKPVRGTIIQYLGYDNLDGSAYGANRVGDMVRYLNRIGFNVISFKYPIKLDFEASAKQLAFLIPFIIQDPRISNFKIIMEGYSFGGFCLLNFLLNMPNEKLQQLFQVVTHFRTQPLITGRGDFSFTKIFWHIDTLVPVLNVARIYSDSYDFV
ncbi:hypothetical protein KC660_04750 [Candidatus Dojkabacteria bacterium]|uniref:Alpha/beta hydrolase n=1 Tax=Candidatus Dojkabacteria bacterium TaxID=2099670 RepID=A0A955L4V1_9BACT|nr:hypothetical protein [Candidatus Dojkabacteria bacterium]